LRFSVAHLHGIDWLAYKFISYDMNQTANGKAESIMEKNFFWGS